MMFPKQKQIRNKDYLAFIRSKPCCVTKRPGAEAAHVGVGGKGLKITDYLTIPLSHEMHRTGNDSYHALGSEVAFAEAHGVDLDLLMMGYLTEYLTTNYDPYFELKRFVVEKLIEEIENHRNN